MPQHYSPGLVALSVLVAVLASYTALTLAGRIRFSEGWMGHAWLVGGGLAMGIGIWAMHFVGMLALSLPIVLAYDVGITALSLLIAILVSTFALRIAGRPGLTPPYLAGAGVAMGIGICSMHYVGMAAIHMEPPIRYDPYWVAASFAIAIAASFVALWLAFRIHEAQRWLTHRLLLGALVMGIAISGMHYAGMVAAHFPAGGASTPGSLMGRDTGWLVGAVTTISLFILLATLLIAWMDAHATARRMHMQASLTAARADNRAKDEFLAMLGHELRNPLASISNAVYLLDSAEVGSEQSRFASDVIKRQAAHVARMVDDLLDVGRAISGKMHLDVQVLDLDEAARNALNMLAAAGKTGGRRVDYRGERVWVRGDRTRLEQLTSNLVANAVENSIADRGIEVSVERRGDHACLIVRDHGKGLDRETASHIFEPFYQGTQDVHRPKGGLGLGLTLVRRIAELHGGAANVASEGPGKGAAFTVVLPAIEAPERPTTDSPGASNDIGRTVLIIEDSADARESLRRLLQSGGHDVRVEADGMRGLSALVELNPHIAFIDIGLPALDGYEVARRARAAGVRSRLVALSGYGLPEDKARAVEAGFDLHLTKPANPADLFSAIAL